MEGFLFPLGLIYRGFVFTRCSNHSANTFVRAENKSIGMNIEVIVKDDVSSTKVHIKEIIDKLFVTGTISH